MTDNDAFTPHEHERVLRHQHELQEAQKTIRTLMRQLTKEQARYAETVRAYNLTVANLADIAKENNELARERDMWRAKAGRSERSVNLGSIALAVTPAESGAIRKAIARLHTQVGGQDVARLELWTAALDALDRQ